jgi:hypothetical protein
MSRHKGRGNQGSRARRPASPRPSQATGQPDAGGPADAAQTYVLALWKLVGAAALILGLPVTVLALKSDVSVEPHISLSSSDPFKTEFFVENASLFEIHSVRTYCETSGEDARHNTFDRNTVQPREGTVALLRPKERTSLSCGGGVSTDAPYVRADVSINSSWRPSWWPSRISKEVCFRGVSQEGGQWAWTYLACSNQGT